MFISNKAEILDTVYMKNTYMLPFETNRNKIRLGSKITKTKNEIKYYL